MKVMAIRTPTGVKAILIPNGASNLPIHSFWEYRAHRAMPATAVGRAKGRSVAASMRRLPGNSYRAKIHAARNPKSPLIRAAISEMPKLTR